MPTAPSTADFSPTERQIYAGEPLRRLAQNPRFSRFCTAFESRAGIGKTHILNVGVESTSIAPVRLTQEPRPQ